jgi:hypothetical protein
MIIVRNVFIAKPGNASKLAAQFKSAATTMPGNMGKARVFTDLTGDSNKVVLEFEHESISQWEASMKEYQSNPTVRDAMKGYTDLYLTAHREILQGA